MSALTRARLRSHLDLLVCVEMHLGKLTGKALVLTEPIINALLEIQIVRDFPTLEEPLRGHVGDYTEAQDQRHVLRLERESQHLDPVEVPLEKRIHQVMEVMELIRNVLSELQVARTFLPSELASHGRVVVSMEERPHRHVLHHDPQLL